MSNVSHIQFTRYCWEIFVRVDDTFGGGTREGEGNGTFPKRKGDDAANVYKLLFLVVPLRPKVALLLHFFGVVLC